MSDQTPPSISSLFQKLVDRINAVDQLTGFKYDGKTPADEYGALLAECKQIHADALGIVESLCMACSTIAAVEQQLVNGTQQLKESSQGSPAGAAHIQLLVSRIMGPSLALDQQIRAAFGPELEFAGRVNQLVSQKILAEEGVDSTNPEAVQAYVKEKLG